MPYFSELLVLDLAEVKSGHVNIMLVLFLSRLVLEKYI